MNGKHNLTLAHCIARSVTNYNGRTYNENLNYALKWLYNANVNSDELTTASCKFFKQYDFLSRTKASSCKIIVNSASFALRYMLADYMKFVIGDEATSYCFANPSCHTSNDEVIQYMIKFYDEQDAAVPSVLCEFAKQFFDTQSKSIQVKVIEYDDTATYDLDDVNQLECLLMSINVGINRIIGNSKFHDFTASSSLHAYIKKVLYNDGTSLNRGITIKAYDENAPTQKLPKDVRNTIVSTIEDMLKRNNIKPPILKIAV